MKLLNQPGPTDDLNHAFIVDLIGQCVHLDKQFLFPTVDSMFPNYSFEQWTDNSYGTAEQFEQYQRFRSGIDPVEFETDVWDTKRHIPESEIMSCYIKNFGPVEDEDACKIWFNEVLNLQ